MIVKDKIQKIDAVAKQTAGSAALQKQSEGPMDTNSIELQQEIHKGSNSKKTYEEEIWETIGLALKDPLIKRDFFVVVLFKKERLLKNILRQYFFYSGSCPTPEYDQTVYHVRRLDKKVKHLWTVPDIATTKWLPWRSTDIPTDQLPLVQMIHDFHSGKLEKLAKKMNDEFILV